MIRTKIKCEICAQEISKSNFTKHQRRHQNHPETFVPSKYSIKHDGLNCQFCGKMCKNKNSLSNHERQCKQNPDGQRSYFVQYNNEHEVWNKGLTKETSTGVQKQAKSLQEWYREHPNHNLGGFKQLTARKCKYGVYKGFVCDSGWELAFLMYHLDHGNEIQRNTIAFEYVVNNKVHLYYPDFIIDGVYYEIKGIYREFDRDKINQFLADKKLIVIDKLSIDPYIRYCKKTYGNNFEELYDRNYPSWLDKKDNFDKKYNFSKRTRQ